MNLGLNPTVKPMRDLTATVKYVRDLTVSASRRMMCGMLCPIARSNRLYLSRASCTRSCTVVCWFVFQCRTLTKFYFRSFTPASLKYARIIIARMNRMSGTASMSSAVTLRTRFFITLQTYVQYISSAYIFL